MSYSPAVFVRPFLPGLSSRVFLAGGLFALAGLHLHASPAEPVATITAPSPPAVTHLTDGEDRLMSGQLAPDAETKAQANALYADAIISLDASQRNVDKALGDLRQVVKLDPGFDEAQIRMADAMLESGQLESAYDELVQAQAKNPRSAEIEATLGYTQRLRGKNDEARRLSAQALARDPSQTISMRVLLEIAGEENDLAGAVLNIEDTLRHNAATTAPAWLALGRLYMEIARSEIHPLPNEVVLKTLLPIYREAAAIGPTDVERLTLLAETYQDLDRKTEALETLRQAEQLEPSNVDLLLRSAGLELDLDEKAKALRDYQHAYELNPNLSGLRDKLGRLYLDNHRFADAVRIFQDALADQPGDPDLEADLGVAYEGSHDEAHAQESFQRAFDSIACPPEAYLKLAVFQLSNRQVKEAGETLALARKRFPDSAQVLYYQAIQDRYAKKYAEALDCLDQMRRLAPSSDTDTFSPDYYLEGALNMSLAGRDAQVEPLLREGLQKYPDNPALMNELAYLWADHGQHLDEALTLGQQAAKLDPNDGAIEDTCGWVYFKMGKANEALPYLQRAAVMTDNDAVVLQHVGDALLKLGHRHEALDAWRLGLKKDPTNHDLATRIIAVQAQANHAYPRSAPHP
jgi:tetratricopeptide (TPR) repeat protein